MPAVRLHRAGPVGVRDLRVDEVPMPRPGPGEVLVEVVAVAIGSVDLTVVEGTAHRVGPTPMILGREGAGIVREVGGQAGDWREGDPVALLAVRACRRCPVCLAGRDNLCPRSQLPGMDHDGLLATHVLAADTDLVPLPSGSSPARAAIVPDTVASAYHALKRVGVGEGVELTVVGLGAVGCYAVKLATLAGCRVVGVDPDPDARRAGLDAGADEVRDTGDVDDLGTDRAVVCTHEASAIGLAVGAVRAGGRIAVVASEPALSALSGADLVAREIDLIGSFAATASDVGELVDLVDDGRLDLTHPASATLTLEEIPGHLAGASPSRVVATPSSTPAQRE
jgi:D-arabinose 1-dehydrogenase-like Zn-dependent alcohol dehydrogenase